MTRRQQSFQDHLGGHPMKRDCLFKTLPSKNWLPSTLHVQLSMKYLLDPLAVLQMKSLEFQVWGLIPKLWHRHVIGISHTFQFFFSCLRKLFFGCVPLHRIRLYVQKVFFFSSWRTKLFWLLWIAHSTPSFDMKSCALLFCYSKLSW